jgi:hypothetical protein
MNPLRIVAILAISSMPLFARGQPDSAKLKADAQKVASPIRGDKAPAQTYYQFDSLSEQIDEATQAKDTRKVDALSQQAEELEKRLGPEYRALFDALNDADPNSKAGKTNGRTSVRPLGDIKIAML